MCIYLVDFKMANRCQNQMNDNIEFTIVLQHAMLVHACSVLPDFCDFQSFAILCELDTLHPQLLTISSYTLPQ